MADNIKKCIYRTQGDITYIKLGNTDLETIIDTDDLDLIKDRSWHCHTNANGYRYPQHQISRGRFEKLHRVIMHVKDNEVVDHINGDVLDARKSNLRVCTHNDNARNRKLNKNNKCGVKGVYFVKGAKKPWRAKIRYNKSTYHLGYFATLKEAAEAYNNKAIELFGEYARLNELDELNDINSNINTEQ